MLYIVAETDGPIKIGLAARPLKRLNQLQTSHHKKLNLIATGSGIFWNARLGHRIMPDELAERLIHEHLGEFKIRGEWFDIDILTAVDEINEAFEIDGVVGDFYVQWDMTDIGDEMYHKACLGLST